MIRADEGSTFTMSGAKDVQARMTTDQAPIQNNQKPAFVADGMLIVLILAFANFLLHLYFNNRYGYFSRRIRLHVLRRSPRLGIRRPAPAHPLPDSCLPGPAGRLPTQHSLYPGTRLFPVDRADCCNRRELGGRRYALVLSAVCALIAPQYLSNGSLLGTNCLEPSLWMGCAYFAILAIKRNDPRYWLWFGVVAGFGLEEKYSIALFGLGIVVGLLLTEQRRVFLNKWIWLGGLAALLIFLPNVLWNIKYDWPFVQLMRAIRAEGRDVVLGPFPYFFQQTLLVNPLTAPIWLAGLFALLFSMRLKPYRALGWCYLVCYTVFFVLHGKNYYLAPVYPMLLAAGAVVIESAIDRRANARPAVLWLKPAITLVLLASGVHLAPVVVPVLSPDDFLAYTKYLPSSSRSWNIPTPGPRCRSGTLTSSAGKKSSTKLLSPGIASPLPSARAAVFSRRTTGRQAPSTSLAAATDCRLPSAATRLIFCGVRATIRELSDRVRRFQRGLGRLFRNASSTWVSPPTILMHWSASYPSSFAMDQNSGPSRSSGRG